MKKIIIVAVAIAGIAALLLITSNNDATNSNITNNKSDYLTPASSLRDAHGLAVDVEDSSKLWIASHTGLHLLKDDKDLYLVGNGRDDYMGFSTHPTDSNILFTSGHPARGGNLGFQKSTDAGKTWQKVSNGLDGPVDFHSMAVDRVNPSVVYGVYQGRMQKSTDGGKTWEYVDNAPANVIQLVAGATENTLYATTNSGLDVSRDQGKTWTSLSSALAGGAVVSLGVNPQNEKELLAYSQKLGLARSTDGGNNWSKINAPFADEMVMYVAYDKNNPATIYVLTRSLAIYKTTDTGSTWDKVR